MCPAAVHRVRRWKCTKSIRIDSSESNAGSDIYFKRYQDSWYPRWRKVLIFTLMLIMIVNFCIKPINHIVLCCYGVNIDTLVLKIPVKDHHMMFFLLRWNDKFWWRCIVKWKLCSCNTIIICYSSCFLFIMRTGKMYPMNIGSG